MITHEHKEYIWAYFFTNNIITELIDHLDYENDKSYIKMILYYQKVIMRALKEKCEEF